MAFNPLIKETGADVFAAKDIENPFNVNGNTYDPANFRLKIGASPVLNPSQIRTLRLGGRTNLGAAVAGADTTPGADDVGVLTTDVLPSGLVGPSASPGAVGLPRNFGPGPGKWKQGDVARLQAEIQTRYAALETGRVVVTGVFFDPSGNIEIYVRNLAASAPTDFFIDLSYLHSITV